MIQINPVHAPHHTFWRSILILSTHLRPYLHSGLSPLGLPTKTLYVLYLSSPHTCHVPRLSHSSWFDRPNNILKLVSKIILYSRNAFDFEDSRQKRRSFEMFLKLTVAIEMSWKEEIQYSKKICSMGRVNKVFVIVGWHQLQTAVLVFYGSGYQNCKAFSLFLVLVLSLILVFICATFVQHKLE